MCGRDPFWITPQDVPVHIRHWKVQEKINRPHLAGTKNHIPIEIEPIRIEYAQPAPVVFVPDFREDVLKQNFIAISLVD